MTETSQFAWTSAAKFPCTYLFIHQSSSQIWSHHSYAWVCINRKSTRHVISKCQHSDNQPIWHCDRSRTKRLRQKSPQNSSNIWNSYLLLCAKPSEMLSRAPPWWTALATPRFVYNKTSIPKHSQQHTSLGNFFKYLFNKTICMILVISFTLFRRTFYVQFQYE